MRITVGVVFDIGAGGFSSPDSPCCLPVRSSTSKPHGDGPPGECRHSHLHSHRDDLALERDRVDLQVFDRRVERRLRKARAAETSRVDGNLPIAQPPRHRQRVGRVGWQRSLRAVGEQHHAGDPLGLRLAADPFEQAAERRLRAGGRVGRAVDARRLVGEVDVTDLDRFAQLLDRSAALFDAIEHRLAASDAGRSVGRRHALADVAGNIERGSAAVGVPKFDPRPNHHQDQREDRRQPQPEQKPPMGGSQIPHGRRISEEHERNQSGRRPQHAHPRPDWLDDQMHGGATVFRAVMMPRTVMRFAVGVP